MQSLSEFLKNSAGNPPAENLVIIGVNPIIEEMTSNPELFYDMLRCNDKLKITIIHENETENFNQSLFYDKEKSKNKIEFDKLQTYRKRLIGRGKSKRAAGFVEDVLDCFQKTQNKENTNVIEKAKTQIKLFQNNMRHNVNIIYIDDVIWYSFTTLDIPTLDMYKQVTKQSDVVLYKQFTDYIDFLLNINKKTEEIEGNIFLSTAKDELIQLYDNESLPRGIYPRKAFYSTNFQRYSIWSFIFNRKGELLLHQRSAATKDNRLLWDKSAGGHVDLTDSSTIITAKRELVEEMFMPDAEDTKFMREDLGDLIDFGEWNIDKKEEKHFVDIFKGLDVDDWIIFRATDTNERGDHIPMTIRRKSPRIMHVVDKDEQGKTIILPDKTKSEHTEIWHTRFISDVFLFIAPEKYIDDEEQLEKLKQRAGDEAAAANHRLISVEDLIEEVETNPENFTDDIVYMCSEKKKVLLQFSEAIKFIFNKI